MQELADEVGCHRGSLYRMPKLRAEIERVRAEAKSRLPHGFKGVNKSAPEQGVGFEAWADNELGEGG